MESEIPLTLHQFPDKMARCMRIVAGDMVRDSGLKYYHIPFVLTVGKYPGISQKGICELIPLDKSRVSIVIRELIGSGFVVNESTRKLWSLRLTERGQAASAKAEEVLGWIDSRLLGSLTEKERSELDRILGTINERADEILEEYVGKSSRDGFPL